jgi:hypothetical protein
MPVASLLRQIQSLLSGSVFPSKLEAELRGKIDLNRHMDQLREQVAALEVQISSYNSRRAELVAAKWERVSMGVLAESREAFSRSAHRDIVSYVKSLHGMVRALKQDAALGSGLHAGASVPAAALARGPAAVASSKEADEWAKRENHVSIIPHSCFDSLLFLTHHSRLTGDRRLLTRAGAVVKMERDLQARERKLKLAVQQLAATRNSMAEEFSREKRRIESEFETRERVLHDKLSDARVALEAIPPAPLLATCDLPEFLPQPGTVTDPSSAIEAATPVAAWAADQVEKASRADDWVISQRRAREDKGAESSAVQHVSTDQVLGMWSNQANTANAATSMYVTAPSPSGHL